MISKISLIVLIHGLFVVKFAGFDSRKKSQSLFWL